ncbi:MAG TPA: peptidoglycan-binding protein [Dongiaceae bacterium]|jgi:peptidoglycan hydrolase-like protein with peptidoglycan-binding domain
MANNRPQRSGRRRWILPAAVAALLLAGGAARADYADGEAAFQQRNYPAAMAELEPLAAQGDGRAQYLVGIMRRDGLGVPPDYVAAYAWLHVAAARGQPQAASARDGMSWRLTPSEIDEAQRLAREWRPGQALGGARTPQRNYATGGSYDPNGAYSYDVNARALDRTETMDLQWNLAVHGYDPGPADGVAGPRTRAAIEQYQMDAGLPVDGRASAALLDHLQFTDPPVRNTRIAGAAPQYPAGNPNGSPVFEELPPIQDGQNDTAGVYNPPGDYGAPGTEGYPGATPAITPETVSLHGVYVATVESELQSRGYHVGPVDGFLDRETQQAIMRYQRDYGLQPTGEVSLELINHLRLITSYGTPPT